ncbi:outer membrane beta-barrel protein [Archangium lansingense]|uniref:Outer membrane beta-barrel protein n=1 Tax=Archangium lansingense TaxID=2995310 RepID=A0ABT4A9Y2_9BACT|nr:outer membrane beta-barrel protein [Archangium lansinium]MCY1078482.1 outer membrane beta-barrel protein [Archangium lansinium]
MAWIGMCSCLLGSGAAWALDDEQGGDESYRQTAPYKNWQHKSDQGPYFLLGGGVEGYSGSLALRLEVGPAYGVVVGYKTTPHVTVELSYSGAVNELDTDVGQVEPATGVDIVRNGGQFAVTLGITHTRLQPFLLGGVGFEFYSVRASPLSALASDSNGYVPAGLGVRYQLGPVFTADARFSYNVPFGQDFAPSVAGLDFARYQGLLQLGGLY